MTQSSTTGALGSYLRGLREERGTSLEDLAQATRLSVRQLAALEADNFAELPAPVFVKGFIRAYCHFLGASADGALQRYHEVSGAPTPSSHAASSARTAPSWSASPIVISLVLLLTFGGGLLALNLGSKRVSKPSVAAIGPAVTGDPGATSIGPPSQATPRAPDAAVARPAVPPVPPKAPPAAAAAPTAATPQRLSAKAIEPTWLRVQIDDGRTIEELLPVGATREWTASKRFVLTIGNAGGVELTLNGRPVPALGSRGAVIRELELPQRPAGAGS